MSQTASKDMNVFLSGKSRVDEMMKSLQHLDGYLKDSLQDVSNINDNLAEKTGIAIRNLQFEDIVRQVTEHLDDKLQSIRELIVAVTAEINSIDHNMSEAEFTKEMDIIHDRVEQTITQLNMNQIHKTTVQDSMAEGEVHLF